MKGAFDAQAMGGSFSAAMWSHPLERNEVIGDARTDCPKQLSDRVESGTRNKHE